MPRIEKFIFYSFLLHSFLLTSLFFRQLSSERGKTYYAVDFLSGGTADLNLGSSGAARETAPKEEPLKEKTVNRKEDILVKSKKKEPRVKEVITPIPSMPIPRAPDKKNAGSDISDIPSVIPGTSDKSGVGVGFGAEGWKGGGSGAGNFPYQWYVQTIKKKLDANWNVTGGFSRRIYAQVAFTIARDGSLSDIQIEESSGNDVFDLQAQRAVDASGPFPGLPRGFQEPSLRVHVRFTVKY